MSEILPETPPTSLPEAVAFLGALPMPVGPVPQALALSEQQIEALAAAGDRVVNDAVHQDLCACDAWPESCVSTGNYFMGAWDVSGLETALPAVLGLWEQMRGGELDRLRARVAELEAAAYGDGEVRLLAPVEQIRHLHACVAAQMSRADTLDRLLREKQARSQAATDGCSCPPADHPHQVGCPLDLPAPGSSERPVNELTQSFAPVAALREVLDGEHWPIVHHDYTGPGRDLPELGGGGRD